MCKSCGCGCSKPNCGGKCKKAVPFKNKADKAQDKKATKGMSSSEKSKFKSMDKKHKKVKTMAADIKEDKAIVKKIKKARKKK